ncbi:MAG: ribonuclease R, partial [Planctomycetes bacterium]|nr:ribonuclease R [Planctomycetota bacterium]
RGKFNDAVDALITQGKMGRLENGKLQLAGKPVRKENLIRGTLRRTQSGSAWLIPDPVESSKFQQDVFIYPENMADAQNGDTVLVRLSGRRGGGGRRTGHVEQVAERSTHTFVGSYLEERGQAFVRIDGGIFTDPVSVGDPGAKGAQPGDKVVVEIVRFPTHTRPGEAVLSEILGRRGRPGVDLQTIIHEYGLPNEFPEEVLAAARKQADDFDEDDLGDRLDLTSETIVTIDPKDARDFDDAISLKKSEDGHWHLGVHIADVAHFVKPGSILDKEAKKRGTSVYLPGMVIPMLPETISNALASLQKGKVRYTKTAFIEFSPEGTPLNVELRNTAINVTRRFAYEQVMPIVRNPDEHKKKVSGKVRQLLLWMHELAMLLRKRRFDEGAIELHLPEVKIELDKNGRVCGAHQAEHDESHQIIEEFMLAANIAVATELTDRELTFLRRTHPNPDPVKLSSFGEFAESLGLKIRNVSSRLEMQALLNSARGKPYQQALSYALLRSFKQAEYSAAEEGHYALAVENYCHFTSPIRRYPDLAVHRLVDAIVKKRKKKPGLSPIETIKLGTHCSDTERRAADAERELTKIKLLMLLEEKRDEVFEAIISGVQKFGIFCRGTTLPVDGFIPASSLAKRDVLDFDRTTHTMTARRSGQVFRLGDPVKVRIAMVDPDERTLHWELVEGPKQGGKSRAKSKNKNKGGSKPAGQKRRGRKDEDSKKSSKPKRKKSQKSRGSSSSDGSSRKRSRRK